MLLQISHTKSDRLDHNSTVILKQRIEDWTERFQFEPHRYNGTGIKIHLSVLSN